MVFRPRVEDSLFLWDARGHGALRFHQLSFPKFTFQKIVPGRARHGQLCERSHFNQWGREREQLYPQTMTLTQCLFDLGTLQKVWKLLTLHPKQGDFQTDAPISPLSTFMEHVGCIYCTGFLGFCLQGVFKNIVIVSRYRSQIPRGKNICLFFKEPQQECWHHAQLLGHRDCHQGFNSVCFRHHLCRPTKQRKLCLD